MSCAAAGTSDGVVCGAVGVGSCVTRRMADGEEGMTFACSVSEQCDVPAAMRCVTGTRVCATEKQHGYAPQQVADAGKQGNDCELTAIQMRAARIDGWPYTWCEL